jgi:ATP synthase I chain
MKMASKDSAGDEFYHRAEDRIGYWTLVLGFAAAAIAAARISTRVGIGVGVGGVLAWINYRWLKGGISTLVSDVLVQSGEKRPQVSSWVYAKLFGRYILIAAVLYVMVTRFAIPVISVLGGLCALGAGAMVEGLYEVFTASE